MKTVRFGLSARLVAATLLPALITVVFAVSAVGLLRSFQEQYARTADREAPLMELASSIRSDADSIVGNVAELVLAQAQFKREAAFFRIEDRLIRLQDDIGRLSGFAVDPDTIDSLAQAVSRLRQSLRRLDAALHTRLDAAGTIRAGREELRLLAFEASRFEREVLADLDRQSRTVLEDSGEYSVWSGTAERNASIDYLREYARPVQAWLDEYRAARAVVADIILADSVEGAQQYAERFQRFEGRLRRGLAHLPRSLVDRLKPLLDRMDALLSGAGSLLEARRDQLMAAADVDAHYAASRFHADRLTTASARVVRSSLAQIKASESAFAARIDGMVGLAGVAVAVSLLAVFAVLIYVRGGVVRRLRVLQDAMRAYLDGESAEVPDMRADEIGDIGRAFRFFTREIRDRERRLQVLASTDSLTGIANRRQFLRLVGNETARAKRQGAPLALLVMDIDHFKSVNDDYGHAVGDDVLRALAHVVDKRLRPGDALGRLGGEEFGVLLPDTPLGPALDIAERLRSETAAFAIPAGERLVRVTVSIGATVLHTSDPGVDALLARADEALYQAKRDGRNGVSVQRPLARSVRSEGGSGT